MEPLEFGTLVFRGDASKFPRLTRRPFGCKWGVSQSSLPEQDSTEQRTDQRSNLLTTMLDSLVAD